MIQTAGHLKAAGLAPPICIGVHAVFAEDAYEALHAEAGQIVTCNTIPHASNAINIMDLLTKGIPNYPVRDI